MKHIVLFNKYKKILKVLTQHLDQKGACGSLSFKLGTSPVEQALLLDRRSCAWHRKGSSSLLSFGRGLTRIKQTIGLMESISEQMTLLPI